MMDHVSARCAQYRLLFPSRNIESIVTLDENVRVVPLGRRTPPVAENGTPVLDLNRLLGTRQRPHNRASECKTDAGGEHSRIQLDWVSTDSERRAALIVDAVDEIVSSHIQHLDRVPFLPKRLSPLCDGVLRDADCTCRLSVRLDVVWPLDRFADRRLWRAAMVRIEPAPSTPAAAAARNPSSLSS